MHRTITPALARNYFGHRLTSAAAHGETMIDFVTKRICEDFHSNAIAAVMHAAFDDILATHEKCKASTASLATARMQSVSFISGDGLALRLDDGRKVLLAWSSASETETDEHGEYETRTTDFTILPIADSVHPDLQNRIDGALSHGDSTSGLAGEAASHGGFHPASIMLYNKLPLTLEEAIRALNEHDFGKVSGSLGLASVTSCTIISNGRERTRKSGHGGDRSDIALLEAVAGRFDLKSGAGDGHEYSAHLDALLKGDLADLHASAQAMALARIADTRMNDLEDIIRMSIEIGLSKDLRLAYNDTDIRVYAQGFDDAAIWFFENIDLIEGNAFISVLNGKNGSYTSMDVYLADAWYRNTEEKRETAIASSKEEFAKQVADAALDVDGRHRIDEDALLAAIATGERPEHGRALSYDFSSGLLQAFPDLERTGYVPYLPLMIESTLERLRALTAMDALDDENADDVELHQRRPGAYDYESVEIEALAAGRPPAI